MILFIASFLLLFSPHSAIAAGTDGTIFWSDSQDGTTTKTGSVFGSKCGSGSANALEEANTLALMNAWAINAAAADFSYLSPAVTPADDVSGDSAVLEFPGVTDVTVTVSRRQVPAANAIDPLDSSTGVLSNNSKFSDSVRMQDCAPRPADLSTAPSGMIMPAGQAFSGLGPSPATFWNATTFPSGNQLDGALFEFSRPVGAFGLWFGDLETRFPDPAGGGVLAIVKLLDSSGNIIRTVDVRPDEVTTDDTNCGGGTQSTDNLGCGNQATRFIGFIESDQNVSSMLVIVGDDDSCAQAGQCDGITEYLSWVGPMIAEPQPDLVVTKTIREPLPTAIGDEISWTLTVSNLGQRAALAGWSVTDVFDSGVTGLSLSGDPLEVDCSAVTSCIGLQQIANGETVEVIATGTFAADFGVAVNNAAYVSPDSQDVPEVIVEGTPPAAEDDHTDTETNNDGGWSFVLDEPVIETTSTTAAPTTTTVTQDSVSTTVAAETTTTTLDSGVEDATLAFTGNSSWMLFAAAFTLILSGLFIKTKLEIAEKI